LVRTLSGGRYGFNSPVAIADDGVHVWVANGLGDSVTELDASNGQWVRTLSGIPSPVAIAVGGARVWVVSAPDHGPGSVTEIPAG
jgi:hypothetical protein